MKCRLTIVALTVAATTISMAAPIAAAELTAAGAEAGSNADHTIPAFDGANSIEQGWTYGKYRGAFWKYKDEKPLLTIDASNVDKYKDHLTPGQYELVKNLKGCTMDVYPSHRDCPLPKFVQDNSKANVGSAAIGPDGWSLSKAALPGVPFPEPKSGIEAMWNFLTRYQGVGVDWKSGYSVVSAQPGRENRITIRWNQLFYYPWAKEGRTSPQPGGLEQAVFYGFQQPAALSGQATVSRVYFKDDSDSYYYFTGQRRVRRLPSYSYDAPLIGFENQYTADQPLLFMGLPDRFDWKLLGKKEIYVPYNSFGVSKADMPLDQAMGPTFMSPSVRRYEMHRVWVIQGTVKSGARHSMPKKTLYLDEDTWFALAGEDYDSQGKLWKVKELYPMPIAELGGACAGEEFVQYDINSNRYLADQLMFGTGHDIRFFMSPSSDPRLNDNYFTSENLQQQSAQ